MYKKLYVIDDWLENIIAHPITKNKINSDQIKKINGIFDATVYLKNTSGWEDWEKGQNKFESWLSKGEYKNQLINNFINEKKEIKNVYKNFELSGIIVDVGGSVGTLREFIKTNSNFVSIDPHQDPLSTLTKEKIEAYTCLKKPLNYIKACAEFLPIISSSVDTVHMRSMLDHVQIPDLALIEAHRILKKSGKLIIGIYLPFGKKNKFSLKHFLKETLRSLLTFIGFKRFADYHIWHPTYNALNKLILENGFEIKKEIWQSGWEDKVIYIEAIKIDKIV